MQKKDKEIEQMDLKQLIKKHPNDADLGNAIRYAEWDTQKDQTTESLDLLEKRLNNVVKHCVNILIQDYDFNSDSDIDSWETNNDECNIAYDVGYRNAIKYAINILKDIKEK
tara:strand:+ start:41 stop:376 length:336 start_codon:yes stop_codon:yes gene_type:complete